ncbi:ABC-2 type transport system permease protein [Cohnella lupini]|uniref:ABC-2 type transport system permease protein n=1 Tax=Cohnella lupini TaxID=1294267 RepID=A0A3D9ITH2_9BACL|nr:ABC-2 type transport system permease protein [Cohnella lupini]
MANFWKLVQNENMKIYRRVRTWIMLGIIVGLPILISLGVVAASGSDSVSSWEMMLNESMISFILITIFTVVVASETVAGEFTWGTIKLLLIRPWSRSAILLSKYLSTLLFALLFAVVTFIVTMLINMAVFGSMDQSEILSRFFGLSAIEYMLQYYLLQFLGLVIIVTFGFMMSSAFRSSGLAIGISISLLFMGSIITGLFSMTDKAWVEYILFMHLDLTTYIGNKEGPFINHPMSLGFSLAVLAGYFILFNLISWTVFRKRDIAA